MISLSLLSPRMYVQFRMVYAPKRMCHSYVWKVNWNLQLNDEIFAILTLFRSCHPPRVSPPLVCSPPPPPPYLRVPNKSNYETPEIKRKNDERELSQCTLCQQSGGETYSYSINFCDSIVWSFVTDLRETFQGGVAAYYGFRRLAKSQFYFP